MKIKLLLWLMIFILVPVAFAQTGLFAQDGANSFLRFGVIAIVTIFILNFIGSKIFIIKKGNK